MTWRTIALLLLGTFIGTVIGCSIERRVRGPMPPQHAAVAFMRAWFFSMLCGGILRLAVGAL